MQGPSPNENCRSSINVLVASVAATDPRETSPDISIKPAPVTLVAVTHTWPRCAASSWPPPTGYNSFKMRSRRSAVTESLVHGGSIRLDGSVGQLKIRQRPLQPLTFTTSNTAWRSFSTSSGAVRGVTGISTHDSRALVVRALLDGVSSRYVKWQISKSFR